VVEDVEAVLTMGNVDHLQPDVVGAGRGGERLDRGGDLGSRPTRVSRMGTWPAPRTASTGRKRASTFQSVSGARIGYVAAMQRSHDGGWVSQSAVSSPPPEKNHNATRSASTSLSVRACCTAEATSVAAVG
jgi:hypothetical protein